MIAVRYSEYEKYGCPNCGSDFSVQDSCCLSSQPGVKCKHCGFHYYVVSDDAFQSDLSRVGVRKDEDDKWVYEKPIIIRHPRIGMNKWRWEAKDEKPENGEYARPRGVGYDLAMFIKSKKAGKRILDMVKEVLNNDNPESWLDYREHERTWIQFKFQKEEFDLDKLNDMVKGNNDVLTMEILKECAIP